MGGHGKTNDPPIKDRKIKGQLGKTLYSRILLRKNFKTKNFREYVACEDDHPEHYKGRKSRQNSILY
jgi:hypothetical protein